MTVTLESYTTKTYGDDAIEIIDAHRKTVEDHFDVEPLEIEFPRLAHQLGSHGLWLARAEDNLAGAFKWRGAFVGAKHLKEKGHESIVVPSAGNHARGAILAAKALSMRAHIVVPTNAPPAKKEQLHELWPQGAVSVHAIGKSFDESLEWATQHPEYGTLLHPYDDPYVAAGQGTLVDDILQQLPETNRIVVPVGGGGLLAGILGRLNELQRTDINVLGVQAPGSDSLTRSLLQRQLTAAEKPNARFGGSAVRYTGAHALSLCRMYPNVTIQTISEAEVDEIIDDYAQDRKELLRSAVPNLEPTSLVAFAALRRNIKASAARHTVTIATGQNDALTPVRPSVTRHLPM